jgi:hypothetical protein
MGCDPFFRHHYGNGPVAQVKPCAQSCNREIRAISAFDMTALIAEHSFQVRLWRGCRASTATFTGAALFYKTDFVPLRPASVLRAAVCAASMAARQPVVRGTFSEARDFCGLCCAARTNGLHRYRRVIPEKIAVA